MRMRARTAFASRVIIAKTVRAPKVLSSHCIKERNITAVDMFLGQYCQKFQRLYGRLNCTFKMHLHMHYTGQNGICLSIGLLKYRCITCHVASTYL